MPDGPPASASTLVPISLGFGNLQAIARLERAGDLRQVNADCGAFGRFALDAHRSTGLHRASADLREAQARSPARLFRGEERRERASLDVVAHGVAGVAHRQHDVATGYQVALVD